MRPSACLRALALLLVASPPLRADEPPAAPPADPANTPAPAHVAVGPYAEYHRAIRFEPGRVRIEPDLLAAFRVEGMDSVPVDAEGGHYRSRFVLAPMLRVHARLTTQPLWRELSLMAEYEHDLPMGYWSSLKPIDGLDLPNDKPIQTELRKLYGVIRYGRWIRIGGGVMTNHWGMGLVANDGASTNWTPGSARFADNRSGDRVIRAFAGTGPFTAAHLTIDLAFDVVRGDANLLPGDSAYQFIGALSVGEGQPWGAGVFVVHRRQRAETGVSAGQHTEATVIDVAGRYARAFERVSLSLEAEVAAILGRTTFGATPEVPSKSLLQLGGAARAAVRGHYGGGVIDLLYASGDGNPYDDRQTNFVANPNFEMGLLLFRYVLAAQTARAVATASDPNLVGAPVAGIDRFPTRGGATNTFAVFPRFYLRPAAGIELYGGPMLAWAPAALMDPLNTLVAGGAIRNALGGAPGDFLGVELDGGLRFRALLAGSELTVGLEGAALLPGSAFAGPDGQSMGRLFGGRALVTYRL